MGNLFTKKKADNFSYETILEDSEIKIPEHQQMVVHGTFHLTGTVKIRGTLVIRD